MNRTVTDLMALIETAKQRIGNGQFAGARSVLTKALRTNPNSSAALELMGIVSSELGNHLQGVRYLQRAAALAPASLAVHLNLGKVFHLGGRVDEALGAFSKAAALGPDVPDVHIGYGCALLSAGKLDEAKSRLREAIRLKPNSVEAHFNIAQVFEKLEDREAAVAAWSEVLRREPQSVIAKFRITSGRQRLCSWNGYDARLRALRASIDEGQAIEGAAFFCLWLWDDSNVHKACATLETKLKLPQGLAKHPKKTSVNRSKKTKVAYVSGDYCAHPTPRLMAGLLETHDRSRFEIIAVGLNKGDGSFERRRVEEAADTFLDLHAVAQDDAIARTLRDENVDIAVDLMAHTKRARPGIYEHRAARTQVNYLGFPGTCAIPGMDYIVVDPFIASGGLRHNATEKLVILPDCYQCNDRSRPSVIELPDRSACGLPEQAFVFGSFNQQAKITPSVFDVWMRILQRVEHGVLWLLVYSEQAKSNLRAEAEARGVSSARLIFAGSAPHEQHMARLALVDVQLDTFPYNAHTTASDALWVGCPIVTFAGESFPSRVCGSLLTTIGVPELIAKSWEDYEDTAVRLALDRGAFSKIKTSIVHGRNVSPLFDISNFCRNLERAYEEMAAIAASGQPPKEIDVPRLV